MSTHIRSALCLSRRVIHTVVIVDTAQGILLSVHMHPLSLTSNASVATDSGPPQVDTPSARISAWFEMATDNDTRMAEYGFVAGVVNLTFSAWLIGYAPWQYFIWYWVKNVALLIVRYITWVRKKWSFFLCDFCYVVNYLTFAGFTLCLLESQWPSLFSIFSDVTRVNGPMFFRIFFTWSTGVLAMAIALFRNSLVFHSFDHMCILAVHLGPPLVAYTFRWYSLNHVYFAFCCLFLLKYHWPHCPTFRYPDKLNESYPDTFFIDCDAQECYATGTELIWYPLLAYLIVWSIPYGLLMFVFMGEDLKREGWVTMYSYYEKSLFPEGWEGRSPLPARFNEGAKPIIYMLLHAMLSLSSFFIAYVMWSSFWVHTIYLCSLLLVSYWNGATFYFQVMKKQLLKKLKQEEELLNAENVNRLPIKYSY